MTAAPGNRQPVSTTRDLAALDADEVTAGYLIGFAGGQCPPDASRSFWHGWRNGLVDGGHTTPDDDQRALAREYHTLTKMPAQGRA
ncbi:hypothetical protein BJ122_102222 [Rhodopseudomonas faecalis]|uniref:Uncharacterized protein n=1 Tax=Rhodopseudomonas faecalis TaxID=99655 RepID=A0A318TJV3_9BRAD|nr:hypothetical protein [Rhodopseudomonas faecalis]PYF04996.1 hypothetical protein BJ122_102222 [Rhodopseudomonas faecalis]